MEDYVDVSSEVSLKQEPLYEDVYSDVKYPDLQNQKDEPHVHNFPLGICMKQELLMTCERDASVMCATVKTEDVTTVKDPFPSKAEMATINVPGPDFHRSMSVSATLIADETPFPVALYQHQRIQPISDMTGKKCDHDTIVTSSREITSDNVALENGLENEKETHRCSLCDYSSVRKMDLLSHIMTHARARGIYKCSVCDHSTAYKDALAKHMKTHNAERPYKCLICDYSSVQKSNLLIHLRTHTGEKPYKCSICSYRSILKGSLTIHMRKHTGEKPYKCSICDYSTANKYSVSIHMRTHTGEKPHKCSICDYSAAQKSALVTHIRKHTGQKTQEPSSLCCSPNPQH